VVRNDVPVVRGQHVTIELASLRIGSRDEVLCPVTEILYQGVDMLACQSAEIVEEDTRNLLSDVERLLTGE